MAGGKFSLANLFGMTIRESANDGSDFTNPDADYRRLFLGEDGLLHVKDSAGAVTSPYTANLGTWTSYTPTLTAATTNPTLGSSTITGRYKALDASTYIVKANLSITTGGAWNAGSGEWRIGLPSITSAAGVTAIGPAYILDSGTRYFAGSCRVVAGATFIGPILCADAASGSVTHNTPVTWATGDAIELQVIVQV